MLIAPVINHLLAQESWAREQLKPHAGKVACIDAQMLQIRLRVGADGLLTQAAAGDTPDVSIRVRPADLPLILQNRERAFSYVRVEGDAEFANTVSSLSQQLRWEAEADLSKLFGDIAAVRMVAGARSFAQTLFSTGKKLQENVAEYFLEEQPLLVRPEAVSAFGGDISKTRDDTERLLKRIEKLERARG